VLAGKFLSLTWFCVLFTSFLCQPLITCGLDTYLLLTTSLMLFSIVTHGDYWVSLHCVATADRRKCFDSIDWQWTDLLLEPRKSLFSPMSAPQRWFLRIIESSELEGTFKGHLFQLHCSKQGHTQLHQVLRALSSLALAVSRDGAFTTSLGNPCPVPHHPSCKRLHHHRPC